MLSLHYSLLSHGISVKTVIRLKLVVKIAKIEEYLYIIMTLNFTDALNEINFIYDRRSEFSLTSGIKFIVTVNL